MKKYLVLFVCVFALHSLQAQVLEPVTWTTSVVKINDTDYDLVSTAAIESGWHLYSQTVPEGGPVATTFTYEGSSSYQKRGNTKEGKGHEVDDPVFKMKVKYFDTKAVFKQRIRIKSKTDIINGVVNFMVCDDSKCLAPTDVDLSFKIN